MTLASWFSSMRHSRRLLTRTGARRSGSRAFQHVSDPSSDEVHEVTPAGVVTTFAKGLLGPEGLAFGPNGNLYVANDSANAVNEVTPAGKISTFVSGFGGTVAGPTGLAFDAAGNLYVCNGGGLGSGTVTKITPTGARSNFVTSKRIRPSRAAPADGWHDLRGGRASIHKQPSPGRPSPCRDNSNRSPQSLLTESGKTNRDSDHRLR
jgi:sugar lactone lactonase YvrE